MNNVLAKRTQYKRVVYRSRNEAKFAYCLDNAERRWPTPWFYEPEWFSTGSYTPDFAYIADGVGGKSGIGGQTDPLVQPLWFSVIECKPSDISVTELERIYSEVLKATKPITPFTYSSEFILAVGSFYSDPYEDCYLIRRPLHDEDTPTMKIGWSYLGITPGIFEQAKTYRFDLARCRRGQ